MKPKYAMIIALLSASLTAAVVVTLCQPAQVRDVPKEQLDAVTRAMQTVVNAMTIKVYVAGTSPQ